MIVLLVFWKLNFRFFKSFSTYIFCVLTFWVFNFQYSSFGDYRVLIQFLYVMYIIFKLTFIFHYVIFMAITNFLVHLTYWLPSPICNFKICLNFPNYFKLVLDFSKIHNSLNTCLVVFFNFLLHKFYVYV
jgi:hypothetical protein